MTVSPPASAAGRRDGGGKQLAEQLPVGRVADQLLDDGILAGAHRFC